jgi:serine/threonine protein kinase
MTATDSYADIVDAPECASLREGKRVFERYVLEEKVGRGSVGVVWKARDKTLDRIVALEFLPDRLYHDAAARDELKRETGRCLELTHPNIVRIHDFLEDGEIAAIAMEYVDGQNLSELRKERPSRCFKPEELSVWVTELCAAVDYAHDKGRCLHRELQPGNLMVNSLGALKITDFGFVLSTRGPADAGSNNGATLGHMSPQQVMGEQPSPSDDIYALGATLYELLTGKPPFDGDDLSLKILDVIPESMAERRRNSGRPESALPAAWEEAIAACLAKEPHWRPASGQEIVCRLGLAVQSPAEATVRAAGASSSAEKLASILKWLKVRTGLADQAGAADRAGVAGPRLAGALSRVAGQVRIWMAPLQTVPWKQYRGPMIASAAILCVPLIVGAVIFCAISPRLGRKQSPSAPLVAATAPAVTSSPAAAPAPVVILAASPAVAPAPAVTSAPVPAPSSPSPAAAPAVAVAPALPPPTMPAAPASAVTKITSPVSAEAPAIPNVPPPLTADQRALTEPISTPDTGAQVRIETVPPGIPFQVIPDSPDASAHAEAKNSGVSPATLILPKGAYRIVYTLPGQTIPRMTSVKVPAAGSALFQQEFPHGVVKVHCQPDRAEVICDGRAVGAGPVDLLLPPGRHEIGARWNGHDARIRTVDLTDAGEQTVAFEFPASSSSASSSAARSHHHSKKKPEDDSLFAKIGRGFKNLFDGDSDKKH